MLLLCAGCRQPAEDGPAALLGAAAPPLALETLTHERFYLNQQRGKVVLLVFWDTACKVCKQEMIELESLRRHLGPRRLVLASVCADPENMDAVHRVTRGLHIGYPTLLDRGGRVTRSFGVSSFPTTIIVTPQGRVGFVRVGRTGPLMEQVRRKIECLREG